MNPLQSVRERQAVWSATANQLKAQYERARWATFVLSSVGALLAVLASQQVDEDVRRYLAIGSAVLSLS